MIIDVIFLVPALFFRNLSFGTASNGFFAGYPLSIWKMTVTTVRKSNKCAKEMGPGINGLGRDTRRFGIVGKREGDGSVKSHNRAHGRGCQ
jgi:hypothetical protein